MLNSPVSKVFFKIVDPSETDAWYMYAVVVVTLSGFPPSKRVK